MTTAAALPIPEEEPSSRVRYVLAVCGAWALWPLFWMSESLTMTEAVSHTDGAALWVRDAVVWSCFTFAIFAWGRRFPLEGGRWRTSLPAHLAGAAALAVASGTLTWALDDRGRVPYAASLARGWEMDVSWYFYVLGIGLALHHRRRARERERAAARLATAAAELESEVARARWDAARLRMQPAFVDATLEAVAALAPRDPGRADALTVRLADLLRLSVDHFGAGEVPLEEELGFLDAYLAVRRLRLPGRLDVAVDAAPEARRA
ncbi:MAG TPA: histidine kinase, partial [Longimicrobium sp.]|nr:histidine kinase [Longimicrobium sp.]